MTFNTALSGLRSANTDLEVTGNNIANSSTVGFKKSRTEFGDVYANALIGAGANAAGSGVLVSDIAQQFGQGNVTFTDNALDLAINGSGFFIVEQPSGATAYTRSGYFGLNDAGEIVSNRGSRLLGIPADSSGNITGGTLQPLVVSRADLSPQRTSNVDLQFNLNPTDAVPAVAPFDPTNPLSFNSSTSMTIYDPQGQSHVMTTYFAKAADNDWDMFVLVDGVNAITPVAPAAFGNFDVFFNSDGTLNTGTTASPFTVDAWTPGNGSGVPPATNYTVNVANSTQFGTDFSIANINQNGFAPGRLTGLEINNTGILFARYTNGQALTLGEIQLANFNNQQGLNPLGDTVWAESFESGQPIIGAPQTSSLGVLQSGALEDSNVDISEELVRLIIAQRNFQANAKTIETADTVTQAIINIR